MGTPLKDISDTFSCLYERRSTRVYDEGKDIPDDILLKIMDVARYAPLTPDGDFPWRFIAAKQESTRKLYANCAIEVARLAFGTSFESFGSHLRYMPEETRMRVAEYTTSGALWRYPETASVVMVPLLSVGGWGRGTASLLQTALLLGPYLGFAVQNMWLAATSYGVGGGYNAMANLDARRREIVCAYLGIPRTFEPCGAYTFGYSPTSRASGPSRGPLEGLAFSEVWGNNYERLAFRNGSDGIDIPQTNIIDTIKNLNLVRSFKDTRVDDWKIERMLDVALWAPCPENLKNWRYLVIKDKRAKEFLHKSINEKSHTTFYFIDPETQYARLWHIKEEERLAELEKVLERGMGEWLPTADTLIMVIDLEGWIDSAHMGVTSASPNPFHIISTGCAIQNMMLAGTALGLGVNFDPTVAHDARLTGMVRDYFGLPNSCHVLGIVGVGEPGAKMDRAPLPPMEALFFEEYWGNPLTKK